MEGKPFYTTFRHLQNMRIFWLQLLVTFCTCEIVLSKSPEQFCGKTTTNSRTFKLSVSSRKNHSNEWEETFTALAESGHPSGPMDIDLTHTVFECDSKRSIYIQGVTHAPRPTTTDRLHFHVRSGMNAAILRDGRSAQKIKDDDVFNSQLFTHRPLRNNEIFEVRLDRKNTMLNIRCLVAVGIITRSPDSVDIIPTMWQSPFVWIYETKHIFSNSTAVFHNYGDDVDNLQVGDRVGVMRSEFGTLHFFYNGVDQGPAASNFPSPVYGIVELKGNAKKVSIVDSSSSS